MLHNEKFCIPLRCPTVLVHPKAQEKKSTAEGRAAEGKSDKGGRAEQRESAQQRGSSREEEQQRISAAEGKRSKVGRAAKWEEQLRQKIIKKREFFNIYYMKRFFLVLLTMALAVGAYAQGFNPQEPIVNDPSVKVGKLENGLTYYIKHNEKPAKKH